MNVVGFYASEYWQVERCDGVQMVLNFVNHPRKIAEQLTTVPYVQNFNLLNPETDGRNLPMVAKPVG